MQSPSSSAARSSDLDSSEFTRIGPRVYSGFFRGQTIVRFDESRKIKHYFVVGGFIPAKVRKLIKDGQETNSN